MGLQPDFPWGYRPRPRHKDNDKSKGCLMRVGAGGGLWLKIGELGREPAKGKNKPWGGAEKKGSVYWPCLVLVAAEDATGPRLQPRQAV
jgi:hypothetical protein